MLGLRFCCAFLLVAALSGCVSRTFVGSAITSSVVGASSQQIQRWEAVMDGAVSVGPVPQIPELTNRIISEKIQWEVGAADVDYRTFRQSAAGSMLSVGVDCLIRADGFLYACAPSEQGPAFGTKEHADFFGAVIRSTHLAVRLKAQPLDADGRPSAGQIVRVIFERPPGVAFDATRIVVPRIVGTPTAESMAASYPRQAEMAGVNADSTVICIMSANGVPEACSVMFQTLWGGDLIMFDPSSDLGFSAATLSLYARLRGSPLLVDGQPERTVVMGRVSWRL
jgi:hypothetical protein